MILAVIPERHSKQHAKQAGLASDPKTANARLANVRRPTRGIQIKNDTYATLKVIRGNGEEIKLVDAGSRTGEKDGDKSVSSVYSNFLIQNVTEERMEKQQVVETFGEAYIFFFGERPRVLNVQGVLINSFDFNWEAEWWHNYENFLRGTKCVEQDARVYLQYDETLVSGYILSTNSGKSAQEKNHVPFMFQMFVTDYTNVSKIGSSDPNQSGLEPYDGASYGYAASVYGPMVLPYGPSRASLTGKSMSLTESLLKTGISAVQSAWQAAQDLANMANLPAQYLDRFLGNVVRVPVGFQGAVALDETSVQLAAYQIGTDPIRYTSSFKDNDDEYVSSSPAYQGSTFRLPWYDDVSFSDGNYETASEVTERATMEWRARGLLPPNDDISNMLARVAQNPIGMKVVGSARNWLATKGAKVSSKANEALAQAAPIVAGAQTALVTAAAADNLVGAVNQGWSQATDRALVPTLAPATEKFSTGVAEYQAAQATAVDTFKDYANAAAYKIGGG